MAKTDQGGGVHFDSVPFSKYQLEVHSPDGSSPYKEEMDINQPFMDKQVYLENWSKTTISGSVIHFETKKPISNFRISLICTDFFELYKDYQITDENGHFLFTDVIPGTYTLAGDISNLNELRYLPQYKPPNEPPEALPKYTFVTQKTFKHVSERQGLSDIITVGSEPVENILFTVTDAIVTTFTGKVTNTKGEPVPGAKVSVYYKLLDGYLTSDELRPMPENPVTDAGGLFKLSVISCNVPWDVQFEIIAAEGYIVPPSFTLPDKNGMSTFIDEYYKADRSGSVTITGKLGKLYNDLLITMPEKSNHILYVKLPSDDILNERSMHLEVFQNSIPLHYQFIDDGYFKIEGVNSGFVQLIMTPYVQKKIITPYKTETFGKYLLENLKIEIPNNDIKEIFAEISLRESGYLWGVITNKDKTPFKELMVRVNERVGDMGITRTDENGYFFLNELLMNKVYTLECYGSLTRNVLYQRKGITPNQKDMHIQLGE